MGAVPAHLRALLPARRPSALDADRGGERVVRRPSHAHPPVPVPPGPGGHVDGVLLAHAALRSPRPVDPYARGGARRVTGGTGAGPRVRRAGRSAAYHVM